MPGNSMLVMASAKERLAAGQVWGTGGWLPAEQREALDWFTLGRLLGWQCEVTGMETPHLNSVSQTTHHCFVLACEPDTISDDITARLESMLVSQSLMVIVRAGAPGTPAARLGGAARGTEAITGRSVRWLQPACERAWNLRSSLYGCRLKINDESEVWAVLDGAPLIVARKIGRGYVVTLAFHPSHARDTDGSATALIRQLLVYGSLAPVAWLDFSGSLILRMDDPGAAQNVYLKSWRYPELGAAEWANIGRELKRRDARLTVAYTPGWVDDGDYRRGRLTVADRVPKRKPGRVYPSPLIQYLKHTKDSVEELHDYRGEYRGIQDLCASGLGDVELHGYTHMYPDTAAWAAATDRYKEVSWFREFSTAAEGVLAAKPVAEHPLTLGVKILKEYFGVHPTTLVFPGDEWTDEALMLALDLGLQLVDSYYLALRDGKRFCWVTHVCSPYLNQPDSAWFDAGLPVVGYFHDREPSLEGIAWIGDCLDNWREAGARRFMDFREFASAIGRRLCLSQGTDGLHLSIGSENTTSLVRSLPIMLRSPQGKLPDTVSATVDDLTLQLQVEHLGNGHGRVILDPAVWAVIK